MHDFCTPKLSSFCLYVYSSSICQKISKIQISIVVSTRFPVSTWEVLRESTIFSNVGEINFNLIFPSMEKSHQLRINFQLHFMIWIKGFFTFPYDFFIIWSIAPRCALSAHIFELFLGLGVKWFPARSLSSLIYPLFMVSYPLFTILNKRKHWSSSCKKFLSKILKMIYDLLQFIIYKLSVQKTKIKYILQLIWMFNSQLAV